MLRRQIKHSESVVKEHENPLKNYDFKTTQFLLWHNVMEKAENMRVEALKERHIKKAEAGKNPQRALQRQDSPPIEVKIFNSKYQRLQGYADRLEYERNKQYEDRSGKYKDNITAKFTRKNKTKSQIAFQQW
eukprot:TRINITY_DN19303_c0_g1_i1.p1 TRINITY_DN19303_c0_g1~~TRINITY_DN19303_c0_g1_i1.p1  ORF type:complete len:132 (+),score=10.06 TRINITY_DN19303_c0_g1_i1:133-528(+)